VSLHLILFLANKIIIHKQIIIMLVHIKAANIMTPRLIKDALGKLDKIEWIYRGKDGYLYSNFYIISTADNHNFHYINLYKFFQSDEFKKLYKRQLQFLFYILSAKLPGHEHSLAIEHLYQNRTNAKDVKLDFF